MFLISDELNVMIGDGLQQQQISNPKH